MTSQDSNDDGGWGDLFAKAADIPAVTLSTTTTTTTTTNPAEQSEDAIVTSSSSKRKSKKRRRKHQTESNDNRDDPDFLSMLSSRSDPFPGTVKSSTSTTPTTTTTISWSDGRLLTKSLVSSTFCPGWKSSSSSSLSCENCGKHAIYHHMTIKDYLEINSSYNKDNSCSWPYLLFTCLRNIRCCAKIVIKTSTSELDKTSSNSLAESIRQESKEITSLQSIFLSQLPYDEGSILRSKTTTVLECSQQLLRSVNQYKKSKNFVDDKVFEDAIRLIISCDALYYRLIYEQYTGYLPPPIFIKQDDMDDKRRMMRLFLPHPPQYFYSLLDSVDDILEKSDNILLQDTTELNDPSIEAILHYCIPTNDEVQQDDDGQNIMKTDHALANIFQYRWYETIDLFHNSGWSKSSHTKSLVMKSLVKANNKTIIDSSSLDRHDTPAPSLLVEWRDSCRDFMCNLYAYATLPPKTIDAIIKFLSKRNQPRLVEYGAGTGYILKTLHDAYSRSANKGDNNISVEAYDILPTPQVSNNTDDVTKSSMNEYHGHTPAYFNVQRSNSCWSFKGNDMVLILCYPPPQSTMAYDILKSFLDGGGKYLIHVGEFKGLTGDDKFEKLLQLKMNCRDRLPTLTWGTDASHVTIWKLRKDSLESNKGERKKKAKMPLLLPCSNCNVRESVKRFRLDRTVVYCSEACCEQDDRRRNKLLRYRTIEFDSKQNFEFSNAQHFDDL